MCERLLLGKRPTERAEECEEVKKNREECVVPWWDRDDQFGRNAHLRELIFAEEEESRVSTVMKNVHALPLRQQEAKDIELRALMPPPPPVAITSPVESRLPVVGPDPDWKLFEHAGLLREIGGLEGWRKVYVHKTHRLLDSA